MSIDRHINILISLASPTAGLGVRFSIKLLRWGQ